MKCSPKIRKLSAFLLVRILNMRNKQVTRKCLLFYTIRDKQRNIVYIAMLHRTLKKYKKQLS